MPQDEDDIILHQDEVEEVIEETVTPLLDDLVAGFSENIGNANATDMLTVLKALGHSETALDVPSRLTLAAGTSSLVSGTMLISYFTPLIDFLVSNIEMESRANLVTAGTFAGYALYEASPNGDGFLVAKTASDPTIFAAAGLRPLALSDASGLPPQYQLNAGGLYGVSVLSTVSSGNAGQVSSHGGGSALIAGKPPMRFGSKAGQTGFPLELTGVTGGVGPWARLT